MRRLIHFIYHALWLLIFKSKNSIITLGFRLKLWLNDVEVGRNIRCMNRMPSLQIHHKCNKVKFGDNVLMRSNTGNCWNSKVYIIVKQSAILRIGNNTGISGSLIYCTKQICIGDNVMIGGGCRIFDTNFHPIEAVKRLNPKTKNDGKSATVFVEDNVFIGTNCIIGKGVRIGQGSVIAAGSVVVKSVPANEIWGGNPAKFIRKID